MNIKEVREKLRLISEMARDAARTKNWSENYRMCRQHDDLALQHGVPGAMWSDEDGEDG